MLRLNLAYFLFIYILIQPKIIRFCVYMICVIFLSCHLFQYVLNIFALHDFISFGENFMIEFKMFFETIILNFVQIIFINKPNNFLRLCCIIDFLYVIKWTLKEWFMVSAIFLLISSFNFIKHLYFIIKN